MRKLTFLQTVLFGVIGSANFLLMIYMFVSRSLCLFGWSKCSGLGFGSIIFQCLAGLFVVLVGFFVLAYLCFPRLRKVVDKRSKAIAPHVELMFDDVSSSTIDQVDNLKINQAAKAILLGKLEIPEKLDYEFGRMLLARNKRPGLLLTRPFPPHFHLERRTKLGGKPDLPVGLEWPRITNRESDVFGLPMHFSAQIDFAELPLSHPFAPDKGTLLIFADRRSGICMDSGDFKIIYDEYSKGQPASPPTDIPPAVISYEYGLSKMDDFSLPCWPLVAQVIDTFPNNQTYCEAGLDDMKHDSLANVRDDMHFEQLVEKSGGNFATGHGLFLSDWDCHIDVSSEEAWQLLADSGFPWTKLGLDRSCAAIANEFGGRSDSHTFAADMAKWRLGLESERLDSVLAKTEQLDFIKVLREVVEISSWSTKKLKETVRYTLQLCLLWSGTSPALSLALFENLKPDCRAKPLYLFQSRNNIHSMYGYPKATAYGDDPRKSESILATRICLFMIAWDEGAGCDIGDAQSALLFIEPEDLKERRFDKAWLEVSI